MGHIVLFACLSVTKLLPERNNWCIFPILIGVMLRLSFKWHVNAVSHIHSESMKNYSSFLNEMTGNVVTVNVQVVQESEQTKKINRILLSIIDHLKTAGWMVIPLRGHRDDSQYHAEVGELSTHAGVGNFVVLLNFAVHQGNKDLEDHSKNCSGKEPISPKQLRIIFWTAVVILWQTPSQAKLNRVIFFFSFMWWSFRFI